VAVISPALTAVSVLAGEFSSRACKVRSVETVSPPENLWRRYRVERSEIEGRACFTIAPRDWDGSYRILYLHGGGYVGELREAHWAFVAMLIDEAHCCAIVPVYPLAPEHTFRDVFRWLLAVYRKLLEDAPANRLTLLGDSAGGGMALALAHLLLLERLPQPKAIVLLSPWLDMSLTNPAIAALEADDPLLTVSELLECAEAYSGKEDVQQVLLSPIHADVRGLAPITVLVGTREIFLADSRRFRDLAHAAGTVLDYHEFEEMVHVWALRELPESAHARRLIAAAATERNTSRASASLEDTGS
jgi:monoterpene epsilon-lactone hydrolase